jgi:hypothetical protein
VAGREVVVEVVHDTGFLVAAFLALGHVGIEVVHHPVRRDRHVAQGRADLDEDDAVLAEETIGTAIVDEAGEIEFADLFMGGQVLAQGRAVGDLLQLLAGMRIDRAHDQRPLAVGQPAGDVGASGDGLQIAARGELSAAC